MLWISFLCYELVLWITVENKIIITNFSSPVNSPIHSLCCSSTDEISSFRLMFICSWQTIPVFLGGEINQKFQVCPSSKFITFSVWPLNLKMTYQNSPKLVTSKFEQVWRLHSHFSTVTVSHQDGAKLHHHTLPSHILLLVNVLSFSPFFNPWEKWELVFNCKFRWL